MVGNDAIGSLLFLPRSEDKKTPPSLAGLETNIETEFNAAPSRRS
jgi:hypothetical protein